MKKFLSIVLAALMVSAMSVTAFAGEVNEKSDPKTASTEITTSITPTYIITIPDKATIAYNATSTALGTVKATRMQIEPNKAVQVTAAAGAFENQIDKSKTIPYKLTCADKEWNTANLVNTTDSYDLSVGITSDDWSKAYGGEYKGVITFTVAYVDKALD